MMSAKNRLDPPDDPRARLPWALSEAGRFHHGRALLALAPLVESENTSLAIDACLVAGQICTLAGLPSLAVPHLRRAQRLAERDRRTDIDFVTAIRAAATAPTDVNMAMLPVLMSSARGDNDAVVALLGPLVGSNALDGDREAPRLLSMLAMAQSKLGRHGEALTAIDLALAANRDDVKERTGLLELRHVMIGAVLRERLEALIARGPGATSLEDIAAIVAEAEREGIWGVEQVSRRLRAHVLCARGHGAEALSDMDRAIALATEHEVSNLEALRKERAALEEEAAERSFGRRSQEIIDAGRRGEKASAERAARDLLDEAERRGSPVLRVLGGVTLTEVLVSVGRAEEAVPLARSAFRLARGAGSTDYEKGSRGLLLHTLHEALLKGDPERRGSSARKAMLEEAVAAAREAESPALEGTALFQLVEGRLAGAEPAVAEAERLVAITVEHSPEHREEAEQLLSRAREHDELRNRWGPRMRRVANSMLPGDPAAQAELRAIAEDVEAASPTVRLYVEPALAQLLLRYGARPDSVRVYMRAISNMAAERLSPEAQLQFTSAFASSYRSRKDDLVAEEELAELARASALTSAQPSELESTVTESPLRSPEGERADGSPAAEPWSVGSIVGGDIVIDALIGRGGMGEVYRAHLVGSQGSVAVKRIRPDRLGPSERLAFERELVVWLDLPPHPNLVRCRYFRTLPSGEVIIVADFMEGRSLADRISRDGPLDVGEAVETGLQLLEGLAAVHARGAVHRDVKPANLLLARDGQCRLADFGLATGRVGATRRYAAPEQLTGTAVGPAADVFGLGATLLHALLGDARWEDGLTLADGKAADLLHADHPLRHVLLACTSARPEARPGIDVLRERLAELRRKHSGADYARPGVARPVAEQGDGNIVFDATDGMPLGAEIWTHIVERMEGKEARSPLPHDESSAAPTRATAAEEIRTLRQLVVRLSDVVHRTPEARQRLAHLLHETATACGDAGDLSGGLEFARRSVELWSQLDRVDDLARARARLAHLLSQSGRLEEAIGSMREAAEGTVRPDLRVDLTIKLGNLLSDASRIEEAMMTYEQARSMIPVDGEGRWDRLRELASVEIATLHRNKGTPARALEILDALSGGAPERSSGLLNAAHHDYLRGTILTDLGRHEEALRAYDGAVQNEEASSDLRSQQLRDRAQLSRSLSLVALRRLAEAEDQLDEVVERRRRWFEVEGRTDEGPRLAHALYLRGDVLARRDRQDEALRDWESAYAIFEELNANGLYVEQIRERIVPLLRRLADAHPRERRSSFAYMMRHQVVALMERDRERMKRRAPAKMYSYDLELATDLIGLAITPPPEDRSKSDHERASDSFAERALELLRPLRESRDGSRIVALRFAEAAVLAAHAVERKSGREQACRLLDEGRSAALEAWRDQVAEPAGLANALLRAAALRAAYDPSSTGAERDLLGALHHVDARLGDAQFPGIAHPWAAGWSLLSRRYWQRGDRVEARRAFDRAETILSAAIDAGEFGLMQDFIDTSSDFTYRTVEAGSRPDAVAMVQRFMRRLEGWMPRFGASDLAKVYDYYADRFADYL